MQAVCVFCGARPGDLPVYAAAAATVGTAIAERGLRLVYGGGRVGLMGIVADAALAAGGLVTGVIPGVLAEREQAHTGVTDLIVTHSMHERKARMAELADAFIALPGGYGTLEELGEILTWGQLGIHRKPVGLLDVAGYYRPLIEFFDAAVAAGFLTPVHRSLLLEGREPEGLLSALAAYEAPELPRWIEPSES